MLFTREFQFLEIDDGGIVKARLDQVGCLAHWHLAWRSSRPNFRGVPRLDGIDVVKVNYEGKPCHSRLLGVHPSQPSWSRKPPILSPFWNLRNANRAK